MKGLILAGGQGSRLFPMTKSLSKQLLPVYDKPMIYYPLGTLMLAGIRDILIIVDPKQRINFEILLGNGEQFGINLNYVTQDKPDGIPQAFSLGSNFINNDASCLILGDNIFHGPSLGRSLADAFTHSGANIFAYDIDDPSSYGVVELEGNQVISIQEKPKIPKSNFAIPGLYFFDSEVCERVKTLKPSARGETEITDLLRTYLDKNSLGVKKLQRGTVWMDSGTPKGLHDASTYIRIIEERQGLKVSCLEEIAFLQGWISKLDLEDLISNMQSNEYSNYLRKKVLNK